MGPEQRGRVQCGGVKCLARMRCARLVAAHRSTRSREARRRLSPAALLARLRPTRGVKYLVTEI